MLTGDAAQECKSVILAPYTCVRHTAFCLLATLIFNCMLMWLKLFGLGQVALVVVFSYFYFCIFRIFDSCRYFPAVLLFYASQFNGLLAFLVTVK